MLFLHSVAAFGISLLLPTSGLGSASELERIQFGKWDLNLKFSEVTIPPPIISSVSFLECLKECALRTECQSVGYERLFHLCTLSRSVAGDDGVNLLTEAGYIYTEISDWDMDWIGPCHDVICGPREKCVETSGSTACEIIECEYPTELLNVTDVNITGLSVGSVISYGCLEGIQRTEQMSVTCLLNGTWSNAIDITTGCQECEYPAELLNVTEVTMNGLSVGSVISYGCLEGYDRAEQMSITCLQDGTWSNIIDTTTGCQVICPGPDVQTRIDRLGFEYKIVTSQRTQSSADGKCRNCGGTLARIRKEETLAYLRDVLGSCSAFNSIQAFWVDGKNYNGIWKFSDGTAMQTDVGIFWANADALDGTSGCTRVTSYSGYLWNDYPCDSSNPYICQINYS